MPDIRYQGAAQEQRLQSLEERTGDVRVEVARQGEQIQALSDHVVARFDSLDGKVEEMIAAMRPVVAAVSHPQEGLLVRMGRIEAMTKARAAFKRRWSSRAWGFVKIALPALVGLAAAALGLHGIGIG